MEPALHRLPVEIWRRILSLLLNITQILDADGDIQGLVRTAKKVEPMRRTLRSVCKGWAEHVEKDPFFIDMVSAGMKLLENLMPLAYVTRSKVISINGSLGWSPSLFQNWLGRIVGAEAGLRVLHIDA